MDEARARSNRGSRRERRVALCCVVRRANVRDVERIDRIADEARRNRHVTRHPRASRDARQADRLRRVGKRQRSVAEVRAADDVGAAVVGDDCRRVQSRIRGRAVGRHHVPVAERAIRRRDDGRVRYRIRIDIVGRRARQLSDALQRAAAARRTVHVARSRIAAARHCVARPEQLDLRLRQDGNLDDVRWQRFAIDRVLKRYDVAILCRRAELVAGAKRERRC